MIRCNFFPSKTCGHTINEFNRLTGATTALHGFPCCWSSRSHQQTVQIRDSRPSHLAVPFAHAVVRIHSELRNKRTDPAKSILPLAHKHKFVSIRWWRSPPLFFFNVCFNGRPVKQYFFFSWFVLIANCHFLWSFFKGLRQVTIGVIFFSHPDLFILFPSPSSSSSSPPTHLLYK